MNKISTAHPSLIQNCQLVPQLVKHVLYYPSLWELLLMQWHQISLSRLWYETSITFMTMSHSNLFRCKVYQAIHHIYFYRNSWAFALYEVQTIFRTILQGIDPVNNSPSQRTKTEMSDFITFAVRHPFEVSAVVLPSSIMDDLAVLTCTVVLLCRLTSPEPPHFGKIQLDDCFSSRRNQTWEPKTLTGQNIFMTSKSASER